MKIGLVGCVKSKGTVASAAKDLYVSPLFRGRREFVERTCDRWFILSAKYGLVGSDAVIEPYEATLKTASRHARRNWSESVIAALSRTLGSLRGHEFEIHAGATYCDFGLVAALRGAGAIVRTPGAGLTQGRLLAFYKGSAVTPSRTSASVVEVAWAPVPALNTSEGLSLAISRAFYRGEMDLSARPKAPKPGWDSMPECHAVGALTANGATGVEIRRFVTFISALDRARDADRLWNAGVRLFTTAQWAFAPREVAARGREALRTELRREGVSQRHGADSEAWFRIAATLEARVASPAIYDVLESGVGDTATLLREVEARDATGRTRFPMLGGPKISRMWVRILAAPGGARISGLDTLPVAVDVQVRKITRYLGVATEPGACTQCRVRATVQEAWRREVAAHGAEGHPAIQGTCAALDPALWFFAKWGCTHCERVGKRVPVAPLCASCRFETHRGLPSH